MIKIDRQTSITFDGDDAWELTQMAKFLIEAIYTIANPNTLFEWDKEDIDRMNRFAYRLQDVIPNESFL